MRNHLLFLPAYFLFWTLFFVLSKAVFLMYHHQETAAVASEIFNIFLYGLRLDLSFSAYLSAPLFLLSALRPFWGGKWFLSACRGFTGLLLLVCGLLCLIDLELFAHWGFRLDATPIAYLSSPAEMMASTGSSPVGLLLGIGLLVFAAGFYLYLKMPDFLASPTLPPASWVKKIGLAFFSLVCSVLLILPIRGGLQLAPINQSAVFFSKNYFSNQAAINPCWNFVHALSHRGHDKENPYDFVEKSRLESLMPVQGTSQKRPDLLKTQKPNIVLIIWESLTSKAVERQGGLAGVTPCFDSLIAEGLLFENVYASGNRSDKGLAAILSGYPAQPTVSIIKLPSKSGKMPMLPQNLRKAGWQTAYYYGGELEFANMKSYILQAGFDEITGVDAFAESERNSKWGAHDHLVFKKLLADTPDGSPRFFKTIFTLSSHEPFEIPYQTGYTDKKEFSEVENAFMRSLHYTDAALGEFIRTAKTKKWWDNTLVAIIADHGHLYPNTGSETPFSPQNYKIPMLWLGGALAVKDSTASALFSQTDLPALLLGQLGLPAEGFKFSQDGFSKPRNSAHYVFQEGLGMIKKDGRSLLYDCASGKMLSNSLSPADLDSAKAFLQFSYQDYLDK